MSDILKENIDYECLRSFSHGAFGKVHSGFLFSTGDEVVIKKGKKKDLKGEYEILKQLANYEGVGWTHIVKVFGYTEYPTEFNIVMEKARCSLDQLLQRVPFRMGLPAVDIIQLVADLGTVLKFLLDKNVVHRDIKPQNILVFSGPNEPTRSQFMFKLCDFGAAREALEDGDPCHTIVGTVPFLNPEILLEYYKHPQQHRTNLPYSPEKCDMWSLGVTIYNASTGSLPWPPAAGEQEMKLLHGNRPTGSICAAPFAHGHGYQYYDTIRAESYPRWLIRALSSIIRTQFTDCSYSTFLAQCAYIAGVGGVGKMPKGTRGSQKRLVLLPALVPTVHVEVEEQLFPGAHTSVQSLFGINHTRTACLTADGITVYGAGQHFSLHDINEKEVLVWNESQTAGLSVEMGKVIPKFPPSSREETHFRTVQECYDLDRHCADIIEAHKMSVQITRRNVDRVVARTVELKQWLHSIERNEKHSATTAAVAAVMKSCNKDMLDQLRTCPAETALRRKEVEREAEAARQLVDCVARWAPLDERHHPNCQASLTRLSSSSRSSSERSAIEMDQRYARTLKQQLQTRWDSLKMDCEYRVKKEEGIAHVIRKLVTIESTLSECVRKMKDTAAIVSTVADQARERIAEYMQTTSGMDEAQIRKNLTNSLPAFSMVKRNVERQAELAKAQVVKMEEMLIAYRSLNVSSLSNGKANGSVATAVAPTVINVNQTIDQDTLTLTKSSFD